MKKNIIGTILVIISVGGLFYSAYFFGRKNAEERYAQEAQKNVAPVEQKKLDNISDNSQNVPAADAEPVDMASDVIKKGYINWIEPKDLGDLGMTKKTFYKGCMTEDCGGDTASSLGVRYIKSGEVVKGKYQGYDFIVISSGIAEGPSNSPDFFRVLKKGNDAIFLTSARYGFEEYFNDFLKTYYSKGSFKIAFSDKTDVEDLDYPDELYGTNDRQRFTKDPYGKAFFIDAKLKKVFVNGKYGQVWMTDEAKLGDGEATPFELNSFNNVFNSKVKGYYDIFGRYGFYMKSPDGTAVAYKLKLDIFDVQDRVGTLDAVWNDGKKNDVQYEENPSSCGGGEYVYDETLKMNPQTDLVQVGKTSQGDPIYGYKDTSSEGFKKLYDDTYWVEEGKKKKSPEEFLKDHPKIFWVDPFGRVLAFYNTTFISPAECGKPVIYLYPKQPMNVSVKVAPGNGLSYTDPAYGTGWNVFSDTKSNLTNLSDGKQYPYLFWEGSGSVYYETPQQGFVVAANELDGFFNSKLAELGLIDKEIADFKEFWIPKMQEKPKPYYFVTFLSKHYIDQLAPLSIDPKPDTVIRVLMDYRGLEAFQNVPELGISIPERKGFTAVEWGGMIK